MPSGDAPLEEKLIGLLEALRRGADVPTALREAALDPAAAASLLDTLKGRIVTEGDPPEVKAGGSGRMTAYTDGASRGNPGQAACAVIITDGDGEELLRRSRRLGVATNNVAEYHGVHLALELLEQLGAREVVLKLDSELVVKQLNSEYKVKHASLKPLFEKVTSLIRSFSSVQIKYIPRAENKAADRLANDALDGKA